MPHDHADCPTAGPGCTCANPPVTRCPTGLLRFTREESARNHHLAKYGGRDVQRCDQCGAWHVVKRPGAQVDARTKRRATESKARARVHLSNPQREDRRSK